MEYLPQRIQSKILSYIPLESVIECKLVSKTWNSVLSHRKTAKAGLLVSGDNAYWRRDVELRFGYYDEILSLTRIQERGFSYDEIPRYGRVQERFYFDCSRDKDRDDNECLYKKLTKINVRPSLGNVPMMSNLIGSCNGLVCLFVLEDRAPIFHIFNPFTGESFDLPTTYKMDDYMVMGFGYNASNSNYKVVRILYPRGNLEVQNKGLVQIYTLGGDSSGWRNIGEINCMLQSNGVLWNGSIYWLAWERNLQESNQWKIAALDLAEEEFRYLPIPALGHRSYSWPQLTLLGGYLSIFDRGATYRRMNIWSFKKKQTQNDDFAVEEGYKSSWGWILEFTITCFPIHVDDDDYFEDGPKPDTYKPIGLSKNNEVFLLYKKRESAGGCKRIILCRYDPKTDSLIKVMRWGHRNVTAVPHMNSFISLKDMGVDSKTIEYEAELGSSCMEATTCASCKLTGGY